jgi:hypothetical protein
VGFNISVISSSGGLGYEVIGRGLDAERLRIFRSEIDSARVAQKSAPRKSAICLNNRARK